jgi:hypothetical protein
MVMLNSAMLSKAGLAAQVKRFPPAPNAPASTIGCHRRKGAFVMSNKLQGLTHAEHQFCAAALARVQYTCASSDLLRDHTIGPRAEQKRCGAT